MRRLKRALMPLGVVVLGVGAALVAWQTRPRAAPALVDAPATLVEVLEVRLESRPVTITAMGVVTAEKQVTLQPEVAGKVIEQNHALVVGGRVAAGDPLLRIDARDYQSAVAASRADLVQAELAVQEEGTLQQVAEHEWRERPEGLSEETLAFALREPHLGVARARVKSARSRIDKAKRDLSRTVLRAPFDAVILSESVDVGQTVAPGVPVATLAGIGRFWIEVSLPVARLPFLEIPEVTVARERGSAARIVHEPADASEQREGYVARLQANVDPRGRMAQLFIAVDDPLGVTRPIGDRPLPLLLGSYVRVEISGRPLEDVVVMPRRALRDDGSVWVLDDARRLRSRSVEVVWREPNSVFIASGIAPGETVVVTPLPGATEGMAVVTERSGEQDAAAP